MPRTNTEYLSSNERTSMQDLEKGETERTKEDPTARYHVPNLNRALSILEFMASHPKGCGVSEIARRLDLPKNSVFRIVSTLHYRGYLTRDAKGKHYRLSRKLLALGYSVISEQNLVEKSLRRMRLLRDQVEETILLGTLGDGYGLIVEQVPSTHPVKFLIDVGHRFPLHTAAPGKAMLAALPEHELEHQLEQMTFTRFNERTIVSREKYLEELAQIRQCGYAVDRGEELESLHCVAAAILNHRDYPLAAIWATGPSFRMTERSFEKVAELVMESAAAISKKFGHQILQPQ